MAQLPQVRSVDRRFAAPQQTVSISGANFGTDPTKLSVFFGGVKGTINSVSDQLLEVKTPLGTTFDPITVINTASGLSSSSRESFYLDFGGTPPFDASKLKSQVDISTDAGLYDHCLCDFDGDFKLDVVTANQTSNMVTFLQNNSTAGTYSFTKRSVSVGVGTIHARCGDLNGDGLPDVVVSETNGGSRIFVFRNTGSFSFNLSVITLAGKKVKQLEIADIDGDGKQELVISDQGFPNVVILPNNSSLSSISFGLPVVVPVAGVTSTDGMSLMDFNGDHRPELIVSQFLTATSNVMILANQSVPGNITFGNQATLTLAGTVVNLKVGDLDGDRLPEITATQLLSTSVSVFLNKSSSSIQFDSPKTFLTDDHPWGLDFGDLDGDSKLDIVVASVTQKSLTVLNNTSTIGNLAFTKTIVPTSYINRHVKIADMDYDGKPDITFTSVDDNNNNIPASKISIIRNAACMVPAVLPSGPLNICSGFPLSLNATFNNGVSYQWYNNSVAMGGETNPSLNVTATGKYKVTVTGESGTCTATSNEVNVTVTAVAALPTATPTNNGPICLNGTLQLSVADVGATQYLWTGPNNYSGSTTTPAAVSNYTYANAGRYYLDVYQGSCISQRNSTVVESVSFPKFSVNAPSSGLVCQGQTQTITLVPATANVTYQWYEQASGIMTGQTSASLGVTANGNYYGIVTSSLYPGCQPAVSDTVSIQFVSLPVVNFSAPASVCSGQLVTFNDQSTTDTNVTANYNWDFGDAATSTDQNPTHTYTAINTFNAKLTISYSGGICAQTKSQSISVQSAPSLSITSSSGSFSVCDGSTLTLQAAGTGFNSYLWSNSATTPSITITADGTYSVSATATNGCLITASQAITLLPSPVITISADPTLVNEGQTSQLTASGLATYLWHPGKLLSDSTIANPVATPHVATVFTVSGADTSGCVATDSVTVNVKGEPVTGKLNAKKFFSPGNGDLINEKWVVDNITNYPQCGVAIYDEKGIKVFEAKPYNNDWDGTFNGKLLPIGAYYYIIRCDGDSTPKTGSITIVR
ncbi:MAG: VCBS repeat-containing protein [Bacteroidetes bacterium]|nr:VCBS repeat-containing protein [Bacteroidota bacterium]